MVRSTLLRCLLLGALRVIFDDPRFCMAEPHFGPFDPGVGHPEPTGTQNPSDGASGIIIIVIWFLVRCPAVDENL